MDEKAVKDVVRRRYGKLAAASAAEGCCEPDPGCCSPETGATNSEALQFSPELLQEIEGLSLGCGDPVGYAALQPGETVLDLGSGAGLDCFLAARAVGKAGLVIGVDMTPEMVRRAQANQTRLGLANLEFRVGQIEDLPLEASSVDVVLSNCVINLVYDKQAVFREAMRVLRPGGRMVVSDIVSSGRLPEEILNDPDAWAACIAGALSAEDYVGMMKEAGFQEIEVLERKDLPATAPGIDPTFPLHKLIIRGMRADR